MINENKKLIEGRSLSEDVPQISLKSKPVACFKHGFAIDGEMLKHHLACIGDSDSGKSTFLHSIVKASMESAEEQGDNVIVFCAKPDYLSYRRAGDPVISITATEPENCPNIFREMQASGDPEMISREIAHDLFEELREKSQVIFFSIADETLMQGAMMFLYDDWLNNGGEMPTNGMLREAVINTPVISEDPDNYTWADLADKYPEYYGSSRDYIGDGTGNDAKGVLSELRAMLDSTFFGGFGSMDGAFSIIDAIKRGGSRIFIRYDYSRSTYSALKLIKVLLNLGLKASMAPENKHRTYFILDEGSLIPRVGLINALSYGRDPSGEGHGGCRIIIALQSIGLLRNVYSDIEAQNIMNMFQNIICFRTSDVFTREYLAKRIGKSRYLYMEYGEKGEPVSFSTEEYILSDTVFAEKIVHPGNAIVYMPLVSSSPFIYHGYRPQR